MRYTRDEAERLARLLARLHYDTMALTAHERGLLTQHNWRRWISEAERRLEVGRLR